MGSFHSAVCMFESLASFAGFIIGLAAYSWWPPLWYVSLILFFMFPVINEIIMTIWGKITKNSISAENHSCACFRTKIPIVYDKGYNIHAFGLEKLHPFDASKYRRIWEDLVEDEFIDPKTMDLHKPSLPSRAFLQERMSLMYLFALNYTYWIYKCIEVPIPLPGWCLRMRLLEPMQRASKGSVDAACMALSHGWGINLGGGFHHATCNGGGGFCIYPDITLISHYMEKWHGVNKIMILDLDAHQGNGHGLDHPDKDKFFIMDAYNHNIYPGDREAKKNISCDINAAQYDNDKKFLKMVREKLHTSLTNFQPQMVIYNAGTDIMDGDQLGDMHISPEGIIKRDEIVFELCFEHKVPVVMILSGGYQMTNAPVIAKSIKNLIVKFDLLKEQ